MGRGGPVCVCPVFDVADCIIYEMLPSRTSDGVDPLISIGAIGNVTGMQLKKDRSSQLENDPTIILDQKIYDFIARIPR